MANGNVVIMTSMGQIEVFDKHGKPTKISFPTPSQGNWCSVQGLPNGRFLVALMAQGKVAEYDARGNECWSKPAMGAHSASRMPNGNTLLACMNNRVVKEIDRNGKEVWTKATNGRPWRIQYR
jgi:hypothetical protein